MTMRSMVGSITVEKLCHGLIITKEQAFTSKQNSTQLCIVSVLYASYVSMCILEYFVYHMEA